MSRTAVVEGHGLHSGAPARVVFLRVSGPVRLRAGDAETNVDALRFDGAGRATTARSANGRLEVRTTEHVFAALGALGIREGLLLVVDGPELPLADGGAAAFFDAIASLGLAASPAPLVVANAGSIEVAASRYDFSPGEGTALAVGIDFGDARLAPEASWHGDASDFRARIAPARTFGFEREVEVLTERGLARHVAPSSVVLIAASAILSAGAPFHRDEPARHKLLDLIGDLYPYGGPPRGVIRATRPGHAATHEAVRRALAAGLLVTSGG